MYLPTVQYNSGEKGRGRGVCLEPRNQEPRVDFLQIKTETDVSILTLFPMVLSPNDLLP